MNKGRRYMVQHAWLEGLPRLEGLNVSNTISIA